MLQCVTLSVIYVGILKNKNVLYYFDELREWHFKVLVAIIIVFLHVKAILGSVGFIVQLSLLLGLINYLFFLLLEPRDDIMFYLVIKLSFVDIFRP